VCVCMCVCVFYFSSETHLLLLCPELLLPLTLQMSTAVAQLCRGVALKALCVSATAFELGPTRQDSDSFGALVQLTQLIISGVLLNRDRHFAHRGAARLV